MLTKKHCKQLADIINSATVEAGENRGLMLDKGYIVERVAEWLAADNPRFNYGRFVEACTAR